MRTRLLVCLFTGMLLLSLLSPVPTYAARTMLIQAAFNPTQLDQGVSVSIAGRVFDLSNLSIPNAVVSIQVNNPQRTSIHVAVAYSDSAGVFRDSFLIAANSPGGNYTTYLVADKPGYDTSRLTLTLAYSTPDFSIDSSVSQLSVQQGESASITLTILSLREFNNPVNLTVLDRPTGATIQFSPTTIVPSATARITVSVSNFAPVGNFTITVVGISGSLSHQTTIHLAITPGLLQPYNLAAIGIVAACLVVMASALRIRKRRTRKEEAVEELIRSAQADSGYVATARVIARLEELRALGKVNESTYQRLKKDYEKRLEKSK